MSRYIDAEWLIAELKTVADRPIQSQLYIVRLAPSIDIVRCKECKYYDKFPTWSACTYWSGDPYEQASVNADDFCSYGEVRDE